MQKFNYHTHVERCGHAVGTEEEMVLAAIKGGFKVIGLSDHLPFKDRSEETVRMPKEEVDDYLKECYHLKEQYKDQIEIKVGFEVEYFEDCVDYLQNIKNQCDYLILGQHYLRRGEKEYCDYPLYEDHYIAQMAEQCCQAITLGLIKYIAHVDYFLLRGCPLTVNHLSSIRKIAQCAKEHDVVLEINLKGTKYGKSNYDGFSCYRYPNYLVFKVISEVGTKVCFGYDAHHPEALLERDIEKTIREEFKDLALNYVEDPFI